MKRVTQVICLLLILSMTLAIPAFAAEASIRASDYFMSHSCYLWKVSDSHFQVWFDVAAIRGMDELGASQIIVERSSNGSDWQTMQTYYKSDYSDMICYNTGSHAGCVDFYNVDPGYLYRARVYFYAKRGNGSGTYIMQTSSITMP